MRTRQVLLMNLNTTSKRRQVNLVASLLYLRELVKLQEERQTLVLTVAKARQAPRSLVSLAVVLGVIYSA